MAIDAEAHHHYGIQVVWPACASELEVEGQVADGLAVVASGQPHRLSMPSGILLLVEPRSDLGEALQAFLAGQPVRWVVSEPALRPCRPSPALLESGLNAEGLAPLWRAIGIPGACGFWAHWQSREQMDSRIARLLGSLDDCFQSECIKPASWRASEVAKSLALSESRFLHLFRQEMGIAWRPYLLWRRLLCAVNVLRHGGNATDAAHTAGFSDNAHLSRTFRSNFGMSIRQALAVMER
ncbi:MAG: helix-turn-helix transcriptional regulator [Marinobacter sp.]|uniref:helix-turn-helix transcriptional regulator n=1 Tax=Marinobacter sp. TaxID=50741 RepID=UPI00299DE6C0|nr:helix-turn-helix transcriptional regulator [Marinobacter sp.]MDX1757116.1 helix-turn-helix transcriptional regulator [Marinobacter sp.]